jgi:hypothetical protein
MAVGIDLGFIALEASQLATVGEKLRKQIARWTRHAILGTVIGSAAMNAFAFHHHRVDDLGGCHPRHRHPGARRRPDARRRPLYIDRHAKA